MQRIGRRPILILDEAQNLNFEALEELRMLSNVVFDKEFALQTLLLGQPKFQSILGNPSL
jgi:type II secretory pathway predicted ATPase ExeA